MKMLFTTRFLPKNTHTHAHTTHLHNKDKMIMLFRKNNRCLFRYKWGFPTFANNVS